jgi:hypothetical protein
VVKPGEVAAIVAYSVLSAALAIWFALQPDVHYIDDFSTLDLGAQVEP